jgi:glycosyltransferase involved in cell wall biosynthesis
MSDEARCPISVCMAAFQGERYIAAQLHSILAQLSEKDEVIVVDDHSSDRTCDEVRAVGESRIRLVARTTNQGVTKSFAEAISLASGSIIFLSDQDDLWTPGKVAKMLRAFEDKPEVTLVASDACLIAADGTHLGDSYYGERGKFRSGFWSNLIYCKYLGCTMAFRSELVSTVIPFPTGDEILHDVWIGVANSVSGGGTYFVDEPLVWYRRHLATVTGRKLTRWRQLWIRLQLLRWAIRLKLRNQSLPRTGAFR